MIATTLFLLGLVLDVSAKQNPSQLPANNLRRRSGSPDRPASPGPLRKRDGSGVQLVISNQCKEPLWPAMETQAGTGSGTGGFFLAPGTSRSLTVSGDWQGRVWGRTNCSFNAAGTAATSGGGAACTTGDCNGKLSCAGSVRSSVHCSRLYANCGQGDAPATLAEWDMAGGVGNQLTFYDISLVDGYNLPIGITYLPGSNISLQDIPPNFTNPACIATAELLIPPTTSGTLGNSSNSSYPIPYESTQSSADVAKWCPWDLQQTPPPRPGAGVYPYPVENIKRPIFNPCLSACAYSGAASDCCTGSYNSAKSCKPSLYSTQAKRVCPDAYSYAYDDATSTFAITSGGGWEVTFCPPGRSTNILKTFKPQIQILNLAGRNTTKLQVDAANLTLIAEGGKENSAEKSTGERMGGASLSALVVVVAVAVFW